MMELEIQSKHLAVDPGWRDLIERLAAELSRRYPEMLRLHVTLGHGRHHRSGFEEAALLANVEGTSVRAAKQEPSVRAALHAAFSALEVELTHHHQARRHVTKSPGGRPQGSIKRVFRDAGYGFIRYQPGRDVYFHHAALHGIDFRTLQPGTPVEFEVEEGRDGLQASRVFLVGERGQA
jgi:cold shock CspA family protein/ribosome-associated translation inhibitor RaiA